MQQMAMGGMSVVGCSLMVARGIVSSRLLMVPRRLLVMLGSLQMVLMGWMASMRGFLCHAFFSLNAFAG
jgi:hypothetical protein